jgi:hypothetical protein
MPFCGQLFSSNVFFTDRISFLSENERPARETPCRLNETRPGLCETSNRLSENSPLLSERVINKRTHTVKTRGILKYFLAVLIYVVTLKTLKRIRINPLLKSLLIDNPKLYYLLWD